MVDIIEGEKEVKLDIMPSNKTEYSEGEKEMKLTVDSMGSEMAIVVSCFEESSSAWNWKEAVWMSYSEENIDEMIKGLEKMKEELE